MEILGLLGDGMLIALQPLNLLLIFAGVTVGLFIGAMPGVEEAFASSVAADEGFALGHIGLARIRQAMGRGDDAATPLAAARALADGLPAREAAHLNALSLLVSGQGPAAYAAIRAHLLEHPRDAMIAQTCTGVFGMIGFSGQPGREAEQLAFTSMLAPPEPSSTSSSSRPPTTASSTSCTEYEMSSARSMTCR